MKGVSSKTLIKAISTIILAVHKPSPKTITAAVASVIVLVTELFPTIDTLWSKDAQSGPLKHTIETLIECFVIALKRHLYLPESSLPTTSILPNFTNALSNGAEVHIKEQLQTPIGWFGVEDKNVIQNIEKWQGKPTQTPIYQALWTIFSKETWYDLEPSGQDEKGYKIYDLVTDNSSNTFDRYLIDPDEDGIENKGRRNFESLFVSEFNTLCRKKEIQKEWTKLNIIRQASYMNIMLHDMSTWTKNHVFGNETLHQHILNNPPRTEGETIARVPFLPLKAMYVAPSYKNQDGSYRKYPDILKQLSESDEHVEIILANFGMGKSLTSRIYAAQLAQAHLANSEQPIPIYIICRQYLTKRPFGGTKELFEQAILGFCNNKDYRISTSDDGFPQFDPTQKYIFILDGFDEIFPDENEQKDWFDLLRGNLGKNRLVIFSRPGIFGHKHHEMLNAKIRCLEPFDDSKVEQWVVYWNNILGQKSIKLDAQAFISQKKTLEGLAILIFMYALIYRDKKTPPTNRADLYEQFITAVAAGKYQATKRIRHNKIDETNEKLRAKLIEKKEVLAPAPKFGSQTTDAAPMVWLLAQLAWTERCLYTDEERIQGNKNSEGLEVRLTKKHLQTILEDKAGIITNEVDQYLPGAILAGQTDKNLQSGILFKHKSFKEFLCAKRWMFALKKWMSGDYDIFADNDLYDAPLAHPSEETTDFLYDLLQSYKKTQSFQLNTHRYIACLKDIMNKLEMCTNKPMKNSSNGEPILLNHLGNDISWRVRRVLFQVLCWLRPIDKKTKAVKKPDMNVFWTLKATERLQNIRPLHLSGINFWNANLTNVNLSGANLSNANLHHTNLHNADLTDANLTRADLTNANLTKATFQTAILFYANLNKAKLANVDLFLAVLINAELINAELINANLIGANLTGADLTDANLTRADLTDANLIGTNLHRTDLTGVTLTGANLTKALLINACLYGTNLTGVDFTNAKLKEAKLRGANLTGAVLRNANLTGANFTDADLADADLVGAVLRDANLTGANFSNANLADANLSGATLTNAKRNEGRFNIPLLLSARLDDAAFFNTKYNTSTIWPAGFDPKAHEGLIKI